MRLSKLGTILIVAAAMAGCGTNQTITVSITPTAATVILAGSQSFSASVAGNANTLVTWYVCNVAPASEATGASTAPNITMPSGCGNAGGSAALGTILTNGLYTAPAKLPNASSVSIVAVSQADTEVFAIVNITLDSGIRVTVTPATATIGTSEQFQIDATVTGSSNTSVTWSVNGIASGNSQIGTVTPTQCSAPMPIVPNQPQLPPGTSVACFTAPSSGQTSNVAATSAADTTQAARAAITVVTANDPTFTTTTAPLEPSVADEGSVQEDIYLLGSDFFSTSQVLVNGTSVPTTFVSGVALRATIPSGFFTTPAALPITVERQNGDTAPPVFLNVQPVRPAAIASSPIGFSASTNSGTLAINGGYFSPSVTASIPGVQSVPVTLTNPRQLGVSLSGVPFSTPGLLPLLLQSSDAQQQGLPSIVSTNFAITPSAADIPSSVGAPIAAGPSPVAVAIDSALGVAVVVSQGTSGNPGSVSLLNLDASPPSVVGTLNVGNTPTGVAVDDILHLAVVVNSADSTLSIVNLVNQTVSTFALPGNPTGSTPVPLPFSVGVNPITHRAFIAYSDTNIGTVVDLSGGAASLVCVVGGSNPNTPNNCATAPGANTPPVSTGPSPQVAIEPQLNWAVVTPGGIGSIAIVDLGTSATATQVARLPIPVASLTLSTSDQGIAINTVTDQVIFTDPNLPNLSLFSLVDQTTSSASASQGNTAVAVNSLTNMAVILNPSAGTALPYDMTLDQPIGNAVSLGNTPTAIAIDQGKNIAVIAGVSGVTIFPLGPIYSPQITQVSPNYTYTAPSSGSLTVTLNGYGFNSGAQVRLDGVPVPTTISANGRQAVATIPGSMLGSPRRFAMDVMNSGGTTSNEENFTAIGAIAVGLNPIGVAVDSDLNEAIVSSQGQLTQAGTCLGPGMVSVVNLNTLAVTETFTVGNCPEGVAVLPRLGLGIVANYGVDNATVFDYVNDDVVATVPTGSEPAGVGIQQDTATALVTNTNSNSVTLFKVSANSSAVNQGIGNVQVDQRPFGVALDPIDNIAAVTTTSGPNQGSSLPSTLDLIGLFGTNAGSIIGRVSNFQNPMSVTYDPVTDTFLLADSLDNNIDVVDPRSFVSTPMRAGINPTAIAYNYQTGSGVTVNSASNTISVFNFLATNPNSVLTILAGNVQAVLPIEGSAEFGVDINPLTNMAAIVDQANGRLLLVPLPR
ncbi:MAG TPA: YncE family protein [Candidatus Acidoferrales bacterium]|nr:YncE family protein [Candidatus Acidoferrales bacterium]